MKNLGFAGRALVLLATIGLAAPAPVMSQTNERLSTESRRPAVSDLALGKGGLLRGQLVNGQGVGQADTLITLQSGAREIAVATTDEQGRFAFVGVRSGLYLIASEDASAVVRAWSAEVAPPSAQQGVLLTANEEIARGQLPDGPYSQGQVGGGQFFTPATVSALLAAGIVGGAIAIVSEDSASGS